MTIDKSLRVKRGATRNRSVMTRVERIARLQEADRWKEGDSPLGLAEGPRPQADDEEEEKEEGRERARRPKVPLQLTAARRLRRQPRQAKPAAKSAGKGGK